MTAPTQTPMVLLHYERDSIVRVMVQSPFPESYDPAVLDRIDRLRVYHAVHRSVGWAFHGDLTLTYVVDMNVYEIPFTPGVRGVFAFSFVNALDEEGPISGVAPVVYGTYSRMRQILLGQCQGDLTVDDTFGLLRDITDKVEMFTAQRFYPKFATKTLDGSNALDFVLEEPIVEILQARFRTAMRTGQPLIDPSRFVVYNRHIEARNAYTDEFPDRVDGRIEFPGDGTGGVTNPDDRESPRISFLSPNEIAIGRRNTRVDPVDLLGYHDRSISSGGQFHGFAAGRQNIVLDGFFGYVNPDLSTPSQINFAAEMLAIREVALRYGTQSDAIELTRVHRLIMEKTDNHTVMYKSQDPLTTPFTGDPNIDLILANYRKPFGIAAV